MEKITVSICCQTFNHKDYIAQALDSFLIQKTTFKYEILLRDDASTDGTSVICKRYAKEFPELIKLLAYKENQYQKGVRPLADNLKRAKGKYIAICEGDDYWTDPLKLQKQVDFLEANADCSVCFHPSKFIYQNNPANFKIHKPKAANGNSFFTMKDVILGGGSFMTTNSMVFRNNLITQNLRWVQDAPAGDLPLMLQLALKGSIGYIDEVMGVYRVVSPGSWSSTMLKSTKQNRKHYRLMMTMWTEFDNWTNKKYHYYVLLKKFKNSFYYNLKFIKYFVRNIKKLSKVKMSLFI
ncbi:glycosyltransferase family 2 protein [Bizionia sediminis]|uniref:Glycosyltransferase family 2 protein n=1 Tax=Bizionia sediminis TaxID=1737064 RepID=A0ABW5KWC7_9FLAO